MSAARIYIFAISALALFGVADPASAQQRELVGYVVAVVGDSAIMNYDIDEDLYRIQAQGQPIPEGEARERLRAELLDTRIDQLLLLQAAERDTSLVVDETAVAAAVQQEIQERERGLGGAQQLEAALRANGLTMLEFRTAIEQQIRRDRLIQAYIQKEKVTRRAPPVTEAELRSYLAANRARLGQQPATVTFEQIAVPVTPTDSALARARALADSVYALAVAGEDFSELARRFTQDPATREQGGDLGYFRENTMVSEFARAAFAMRPGMISPPVRTTYGLHVIKLERVRGAERQARHILIRPETTAEDVQRAEQLARDIAEQLRNGADLDSLIARHGDREEQQRVGPIVRDQLPEPYLSAMTNAAVGQVVGPLPIGDAGSQKFAVARVEAVQQSGEYTLDDPFVRQRIRQLVEQEKLFAEIVGELRRRTHIDVRQG